MQTGQLPAPALLAFARATALVADGLSEDQLIPLVARCAVDAIPADLAAVYLQSEEPSMRLEWRLAGQTGAEPQVVKLWPRLFGEGGGLLTRLFQGGSDFCEDDLLDGAPTDNLPPHQLPARSLAGVSFRRRDGRRIGVLLAGSRRSHAFRADPADTLRVFGQLLGIGIDNARLAAAQQRERRLTAESSVTLGTVLGSVDTGVCIVELDGTIRVANKPLQDLFGLGSRTAGLPQEIVFGRASIQPRSAQLFLDRLRELIAEPSQIEESEWELATDPPRIVQRYSAPIRNQVGEVVGRVEVYTDITDQRRLYAKLLSSEKLRAIGEMASGVAHDFNNVLASIVGQTELLHPEDVPPTMRHAIATMHQAALDGARMVRNLQGLARPSVESLTSTADLNLTVREAVEMARPRWSGAVLHGRGPIEVSLLLDSTLLPRVAIDPSELREVLLNLLSNAVDAMPRGGRIELATLPGHIPGMVQVEVRDTGQGMVESVRARIFEPFFSTKGPKGSGLGLAVTYSIITRRGGHVGVRSRIGEGTTFTIDLPYVTVSEPVLPSPSASTSASHAQHAIDAARSARIAQALKAARILIVDDEPGLVAIVRQLMERSGGVVSVAGGGAEAIQALHTPGSKFDVVITDLDMPDVDGWDVAAAVKARSPSTHVVMLTGWAGEIVPNDFKARGVDVVLGKPCSRAELELAIGTLLAPERPSGLQILLVDDEPAFGRAVGDLLGLQGHHVSIVASASAALELFASRSFDVVLTDFSLGEVTGAQLAERLADLPSPPYVILVSGYASSVNDPHLLTRGVNAVLPKPCRGEDLREALSHAPAPVPSADLAA